MEFSQFNDEGRQLNAQQMADNVMASNIPASQLIIGSWQRISKNTDDLTAKIFYKQKKLWWEVLDGGFKRKIEMQWDNISAISAHTLDNGVGKLEIQLNQPPSFAQKSNHQRIQRHTIWKKAQDFTGRQASICRRHTVYFPPGKLEPEFKTLIKYDLHLLDLSNKPFPCDDYPYFHHLSPFLELPLPTDITGYLPELPHSQHNYPVQSFPPQPILPPHSNNLTQRTDSQFDIINQLSPLSDMDPLFIDEGGRRSYTYENQWGNQGVNDGGSNYTYENQWGNNGVNNHNQGLDSIPSRGNDFQNYNLNYEGESSGIMNNPNTMHWLPPHHVPYEGMSVNSTMNTSVNQYEPPRDQVFQGSINVNSSINSRIQRLDYVPMATAQGNSYQNYNLNKQRLNNLARVASKYQAEYSSTIQDHPLPIQSMPPHQDSNEAMTVYSSVNTSMYQYRPQCQISNVGMSVNSAGRTPLCQYAPTHQVSGMSINTAMPTPMYQYVPTCQAFSRGMSVNSAISTPMHQSAAPSHVSNNATDVTSTQSSAYQYTLPDQSGNQGVNNGGSNYTYENIQWGNNGINNHNQGLDFIPVQGNEIQINNLNYGDESSRMNKGMNVDSANNTSMHQYEPHHDQVYNGSMNANSSMNAFTNTYLSPEPAVEDFSAMAAGQNTHHWN